MRAVRVLVEYVQTLAGRSVRFLSVCSGIEAASCAWNPLGMEALAVSEVDKFPSAVLAHHYPSVLNLGDMTRFKDWNDYYPDILVGGTPCQSFSVAGLRKGLADPRGNLMLTYLAIADRYQPEWIVWENVPGVLSSGQGRDFGTFLGALGQIGYGWAYRVLDAQFFGVPQRRRRVFVVGHLGEWRRAAAVLFERHSLQRNTPPSRETGQGFTHPIAPSLTSSGRGVERGGDTRGQDPLVATHRMVAFGEYASDGTASAMKMRDYKDATDLVTHSLRAEGFDASEDGTGRGTPLVPIAFNWQEHQNFKSSTTTTNPLTRGQIEAVAVALRGREGGATAELSEVPSALRASGGGGDKAHVLTGMQVRRLTPRECERLQGFPDDYTLIPYGKKPSADGPRYKALGNSMADEWRGHAAHDSLRVSPLPDIKQT